VKPFFDAQASKAFIDQSGCITWVDMHSHELGVGGLLVYDYEDAIFYFCRDCIVSLLPLILARQIDGFCA